jgi:hypothetical protein
MPKMTDSELISLLSTAENQAAEYSGEFSRENEKYLKAYLGEKSGDFAAIPNQSSVVSTDIADVVESDMPSLARIFLGSGDILEFQANTENEVEVAEAEEKTKYVNWVIRNQPESFQTLHNWMKDAEIQKNGVVKYFIDERKEVEEVEYTGVDGAEIAAIQESIQGADVDKVKVEVSEQIENEQQTFDIKFRVTRNTKKICIVSVPPERFRITRNATSLDDAELVGDVVDDATRGSLLAQGFSRELIDQLPTISDNTDSGRGVSSNLNAIRNRDQGGANESESINDWASQKVELKDLYVKVDYDGDGIAERRHIMMSGNKVLVNEAFNHVPYASLSAILMPHKAIGRSRAEITYETQRQKTALQRGMNDNIYMVNNPRNVVHPDVDLDDMLTVRTNGIVRLEDDTKILPQQAVMPLAVPYIGDRTLQVLQYVDQTRAQTTGALLANQGLDSDAIGRETATRFEGVRDDGQAKIELIARNYAETGWRKLFEGVAWLASRYQDTATEFRVLGKALTVNPSSWKYNHHVESKVGLGAGSNEQLIEARQGIYTIQQQLKAGGSKIVDDEGIYKNLASLTDGLGFNRSEQLFNNPAEPNETLRADNEQLNAMVIQMQEAMQMQSEQIRQLQAFTESKSIEAQAKLMVAKDTSDQKTADRAEKIRQFNISTAQNANQHQTDTAVDLTKIEVDSGQDINGALV